MSRGEHRMSSNPVSRSRHLFPAVLSALLSHGALAADSFFNFTLQWTDRVGNTHALPNTWADFWEADPITADDPMGTFYTSGTGTLNLVTGADDFPTPTLEIYSFLRPDMNMVGLVRTDYAGFGVVYSERAPATGEWNLPVGGALNQTHTVNNTTLAGTAMGFLNFLNFGKSYFSGLGMTTPVLNIRYAAPLAGGGSPYNDGGTANWSYAGGTNMTIGYGQWGSSDTILHEYGHIIAGNNALDVPAGDGLRHCYGRDNISLRPCGGGNTGYGALTGARLAWQEGIATYLGLSAVKDGDLNTFLTSSPA